MCNFYDSRERFWQCTPMVLQEWKIDVQRLEPAKQLQAGGSWLQPATVDGQFGQGLSCRAAGN